MDYVTRQFINLTKKLRKELRDAVRSLDKALTKQSAAIKEAADASKQGQHTPTLRTEFHIPQSDRYKQETKDARKSIIEFWKVYIEIVGILVVVAYTTVAAFQLREMTKQYPELHTSAEAARTAADVAKEALYSVQRAFVIFPADPQVDVYRFPSGSFLHLEMPIENAGATPAHATKDRVSCVTPMGPIPNDYAFPTSQRGDVVLGGLPTALTSSPPRAEYTVRACLSKIKSSKNLCSKTLARGPAPWAYQTTLREASSFMDG
jgi:hypothetical protein